MTKTDFELVSEPIPNMALLDQVVDHIEAHPETWNQGVWACQTGMCFAGWAVELTEGVEALGDYFGTCYAKSGEPIWEVSTRVLGLTPEEEQIYAGDNTLPEIKRQVEAIRYRAKAQAQAFDRIAQQLIDTVESLPEVVKPGYLCPESQEIVKALLGGTER